MLLGGINIPEALLTAHEEGRLVIFTGAGISMGLPSNLPNFLGLAEQVATKLQSPENPNSEAWKPQLDAFLGKLDDDAEYDVHRLVKRIVSASTSTPNANHDALARIAAKGTARVVTTNYDLHLERRLRVRYGADLEVFRAPAMPLGDDFEGLVYLHGSADTAPERLVVTDRDFSRAYFHAAWAARFLERMFSEYVVLFVGYSHSDVVMKYLGLGLGPRAERYVITDDPNNDIWDRLRVNVLNYPDGQHDVLTKCLTEWADLGEMGLLEHRQRIRTIVSGTSPTPEQSIDLLTPPAELSYLQDAIRRPDRVGFFCDYAKDPGWLEWVRKEEPFSALFDRTHQWHAVSSRLADWFAETFAYGNEEVSKKAWAAFAEAGGTLGTILWNALAIEMHRYRGVRPPHVLRWVWLLLEQEHVGCLTDYLEFGLGWDGVWEDRELSLAILEHLMAPQLKPERTWGTAGLTVDTRGDLYWLDTAWAAKFTPELDATVSEVFPIVERALTRHLILEKQATGRRLGFSWRRPAIQPHPQDQSHHRETIDAVIDAARDCIERLWPTNPSFAQRVIYRWVASDHTLLQRLAVHGAGVSPTLDADARVRFVLDNDLATTRDTLQEVFHLLASAAKALSTDVVDELLAAYAPASDDIHDQFSAFTAYELLERSGVVSERLSEVLAAIKAVHDFTPDEYPGMTGAMVFTWVEDRPPLSTEEFAKKVKNNPAKAVQFVLGFEAKVVPRGTEPTREDAVTMLRSTVQQHPAIGLDLWPHLGTDEELRGAIISAWGHTTDPEEMTAVLAVLITTDLKVYDHQVGQFLLHAAQAKDVHWEDVPGVDDFIDAVWKACETSETYVAGEFDDWLSVTINEPVGHLLEFWFRVFHRRWTAAGDDWDGLPERDRKFLDRALADQTRRGAHALTQISSRLEYLDQADSAWCRQQLLPLRDWANPAVAEPFWWGVLSYGRWNSGLAADGLLDGLVETATHLEAFTDDQRRRLAGLLASIAVRCEAPAADAWVEKFTACASVEDRERWIDSLGDELGALDEAGRAATWANWLHSYWHRRTQDDPIVFERSEMDAFASVAPQAPVAEFEDAVVLVEATSAGFGSHADASRHVIEGLIDSHPEAVGRYYTHLMRNTPLPFYGSFELRPKLEQIVAKPGSWDALKAAALGLEIDLT
jgi:hypothetical protein